MIKLLLAVVCLGIASRAAAQTAAPDQVKELEGKLDALSQEVEKLKIGGGGPSSWTDKLSLGGYAELNAQVFARRNQKGDGARLRNISDLQRFVLLAEYRFSDRLRFKSELEVEHAGSGDSDEKRGEVELEQAYVDFLGWESLNARAGHLLVPSGLINETHEPPTYHGVLRPSVDTSILPTTWHENGLGLFGSYGILSYRTYVVAGLNAVKNGAPAVDGFTGSAGLRGGRSEGSQSAIDDLAWVGRVDLKPVPGLLLGGSLYSGGADQNTAPASVPVTLWEVHGDWEGRGLELRALYAQSTIGNAGSVNTAQVAQNAAFSDFVGRRQFGGYAQAAFNALSLCRDTAQYLAPFFRYERYDTQSQVPNGFTNNAANSRVEYTAGLTYRPIPKVVLKTDYQWKRNQARTGVNQWNLGLGLMF